jgi:hypothetical protein
VDFTLLHPLHGGLPAEGGRHQLGGGVGRRFGVERTICDMARVTYESKDDASHKFWVAHYGRYVIRIDANRRGVYRWLITLQSQSVRKGIASDRDQADAAVSDALDQLPHQMS